LCTQFEVESSAGNISIVSKGDDGMLMLSSESIQANSSNCDLSLSSEKNAGKIHLATNTEATDSAIVLDSSSSTHTSLCKVSPDNILLVHGAPGMENCVHLRNDEMLLAMGPALVGSKISIKPTSITLQVGPLTSLTLTADGIVLASGVTKMALGVQGIKEELGPITRSLGLMGHSMVAAESAVDVTPVGVNAKGPTGSFAFNATGQLSALLLTESADAIMNKKAPLANISS
jgi:hypothetical protein